MKQACAVLEISPSTYYAAKKREEYPCARDERDEELKMAIARAREKKGRRLYGAKKMWRELNRDGIKVARCTREWLMRERWAWRACGPGRRGRGPLCLARPAGEAV